jgi:ketosteroid isomerase-like protein
VLHVTSFLPEVVLIEADRAATLNRLTGLQHPTGRTVSYRCAHFLRFSGGKVIELRAVIDSFDAAEQILGHPIDLSPMSAPAVASA